MKYFTLFISILISCNLFSQEMEKGENGYYSFVNVNGKVLFPNQIEAYKYLGVTVDLNENTQYPKENKDPGRNFILISVDKKNGIINSSGEVVLPLGQNDISQSYSKDSLIVYSSTDGSPSILDLKTGITIKTEFDEIKNFHEGYAVYKINPDKAGIINSSGEIVIPAKKQFAEGFSEGLLRVQRGSKYGFIDEQGKTIIPFEYDQASHFTGGFSIVNIGGDYNKQLRFVGGKYGIIDQTGDPYVPIEYDKIEAVDEFFHLLTKGKKQAIFYNNMYEITTELIYRKLMKFPNSEYWYHEIKKKKGVITPDGYEVLPCIYDTISYKGANTFEVTIGTETYLVDSENERIE